MSNTETTAVTELPEFDSKPAAAPPVPVPSTGEADAPRRAARGTMPPLPGDFLPPDDDDDGLETSASSTTHGPSSSDVTRADARLPEEVRRAFDEDPHELHTVPAPLVDADEIGLEELSEDDLELIEEDSDDNEDTNGVVDDRSHSDHAPAVDAAGEIASEDGAARDDDENSFNFEIVEDAELPPEVAALAALQAPPSAPESGAEPAPVETSPAPGVALEPRGARDRHADPHHELRHERSIEHLEPSADSVEVESFQRASATRASAPEAADAVAPPPHAPSTTEDASPMHAVVPAAGNPDQRLAAGEVVTEACLQAPTPRDGIEHATDEVGDDAGDALTAAATEAAGPEHTGEAGPAPAEAAPRRITERDLPPLPSPRPRADDPLLRSTVRPSQRLPSLEDLARVQNSIATLLPESAAGEEPAAEDAAAPAPARRRWFAREQTKPKEPLFAGAMVGGVAAIIAAVLLLSGPSEPREPAPGAAAPGTAAAAKVVAKAPADAPEARPDQAVAAAAPAPVATETAQPADTTKAPGNVVAPAAPALEEAATTAARGQTDEASESVEAGSPDAQRTETVAAVDSDAVNSNATAGAPGAAAPAAAPTDATQAGEDAEVTAPVAPAPPASEPPAGPRVMSEPLAEPPADTGTVRAVLASEPPGAVVTLLENGNARVLGPAPVKVELDRSNRYEAVFALEGYRSVLSRVAMGSNDTLELRVSFKRPTDSATR